MGALPSSEGRGSLYCLNCFGRAQPNSTTGFFDGIFVNSGARDSLDSSNDNNSLDSLTRDATPEDGSNRSRGKKRSSFAADNNDDNSSIFSNTSDSELEYEDVLRRFVKKQRGKLQVEAEFLSEGTKISMPVKIRIAEFGQVLSWHQVDSKSHRVCRDPIGSIKCVRLVRVSPHTKNPCIVEIVVNEKNTTKQKTMWFKFVNALARQEWESAFEAVWRNVKKHNV